MKNSHNLVRCDCCNALYDKTVKLVRGYYHGTSTGFTTISKSKDGGCPVCGKVLINTLTGESSDEDK